MTPHSFNRFKLPQSNAQGSPCYPESSSTLSLMLTVLTSQSRREFRALSALLKGPQDGKVGGKRGIATYIDTHTDTHTLYSHLLVE